MSKRAMEQIRKMLCKELDEIADKGELSMGDLELTHKLTDTIKNIDKIECMNEMEPEESRRMSRNGDWRAEGRYSKDETGGTEYGRASERRGRDAMGRYTSRGDGMEDMMRVMDEMIEDSRDQREREILEKAKRTMQHM